MSGAGIEHTSEERARRAEAEASRTEGMSESYRWRFEDPSGRPRPEGPEHSVPFPTQADAEAWFAESWQDLADAGVAQVSLLHEAEVVYGPMPLSAG